MSFCIMPTHKHTLISDASVRSCCGDRHRISANKQMSISAEACPASTDPWTEDRIAASDATILQTLRMPLASPDFAPFLQRARDLAAFASVASIGGSRCEAPIVAYRSFVGCSVVHSATAKQYCPRFIDRGAPANSRPTIAVVDGRTRSTSLEKQGPTALWTRR
jgi:hypothetical protein